MRPSEVSALIPASVMVELNTGLLTAQAVPSGAPTAAAHRAIPPERSLGCSARDRARPVAHETDAEEVDSVRSHVLSTIFI